MLYNVSVKHRLPGRLEKIAAFVIIMGGMLIAAVLDVLPALHVGP